MKFDFDTWLWCKRNGIRYVEYDPATGMIVHFWKSGNRARCSKIRKDTYICSTNRYFKMFLRTSN